MDIHLVNIGFGNIVSANRIVVIVSPDSAPIKRMVQEARDNGRLIDATYGSGPEQLLLQIVTILYFLQFNLKLLPRG